MLALAQSKRLILGLTAATICMVPSRFLGTKIWPRVGTLNHDRHERDHLCGQPVEAVRDLRDASMGGKVKTRVLDACGFNFLES